MRDLGLKIWPTSGVIRKPARLDGCGRLPREPPLCRELVAIQDVHLHECSTERRVLLLRAWALPHTGVVNEDTKIELYLTQLFIRPPAGIPILKERLLVEMTRAFCWSRWNQLCQRDTTRVGSQS